MLLLLMRHGIAKTLSDSQNSDDFHRALTREGRKRVRLAARGLRELISHLDFLASSPKTRARQTTLVVRDVWGKKAPPLTEWSELMEDDFASLLEKLRALNRKNARVVLLCGHEPHLSRFTSLLLTNETEKLALDWKKAGVCALEIDFDSQKMKPIPQKMKRDSQKTKAIPQKIKLLWLLTPKQLREIGES